MHPNFEIFVTQRIHSRFGPEAHGVYIQYYLRSVYIKEYTEAYILG